MLIERLSLESGLSAARLRYFAKSASQRYYVFSVKKASGGWREIAHPARPLKAVQRWISKQYLSQLPVHAAATAYRKGINIRENAQRHAGTRFTLRIDFKDFFPSFHVADIRNFLRQVLVAEEVDDSDIDFISQIVTREGGLTIGAPTSPALTNAIMYSFDSKLAELCGQRSIVYTRYADDIFMSTNQPNVLGEMYQEVVELAKQFEFARLVLNRKKTAFLSKRYHREITGLVLTPDGRVSIGRDRKREIKALVHAYFLNQLAQDREEYLKGLLSFAQDAEPSFYQSLIEKYGEDVHFILHFQAKAPNVFGVLETLDPPANSN